MEATNRKMDTCHTPLFVLLLGLFLARSCVAAPSPFSSLISGRVVNGENALPAEFPFMASLRTPTGLHTCGATIIHQEWVMTAAHCMVYDGPADYTVQWGTNEISPNGENVSQVKRVIVHQGYDNVTKSFVHDIALLQLVEPIVFNDRVQAVRLPDYMEMAPGGERAELIGWGLNDVSVVVEGKQAEWPPCAGMLAV